MSNETTEQTREQQVVIAICDAIRRPMGVIPMSAEPFVTPADLEAAERRRGVNSHVEVRITDAQSAPEQEQLGTRREYWQQAMESIGPPPYPFDVAADVEDCRQHIVHIDRELAALGKPELRQPSEAWLLRMAEIEANAGGVTVQQPEGETLKPAEQPGAIATIHKSDLDWVCRVRIDGYDIAGYVYLRDADNLMKHINAAGRQQYEAGRAAGRRERADEAIELLRNVMDYGVHEDNECRDAVGELEERIDDFLDRQPKPEEQP